MPWGILEAGVGPHVHLDSGGEGGESWQTGLERGLEGAGHGAGLGQN